VDQQETKMPWAAFDLALTKKEKGKEEKKNHSLLPTTRVLLLVFLFIAL